MKATLSKSVFVVTAILFGLVACADDADPPAATDTGDAGAPATTVPPASTPTTTATAEAKCPSSCKADTDCESECPPLAGGVQCCDTKSGTCFGSKTATCPAPTTTDDDAGTPSY